MKKFLCAMLAICMLCAAGMFVGCKKDKGGNANSSTTVNSDNINGVPEGWN